MKFVKKCFRVTGQELCFSWFWNRHSLAMCCYLLRHVSPKITKTLRCQILDAEIKMNILFFISKWCFLGTRIARTTVSMTVSATTLSTFLDRAFSFILPLGIPTGAKELILLTLWTGPLLPDIRYFFKYSRETLNIQSRVWSLDKIRNRSLPSNGKLEKIFLHSLETALVNAQMLQRPVTHTRTLNCGGIPLSTGDILRMLQMSRLNIAYTKIRVCTFANNFKQACEDKCIAEENCKAALMLTSEPGVSVYIEEAFLSYLAGLFTKELKPVKLQITRLNLGSCSFYLWAATNRW